MYVCWCVVAHVHFIWSNGLNCECTLFVTAGIWATDLSTCLWRRGLMNGLVLRTATSALTTAAPDPISLSTTTLRWLAGSFTHKHSDIHNSRQKQWKSITIFFPWWLSRIVWLAAPLDELSVSPPLPSLYQLCLCIPFSAHLFSPKHPYAYSGSLELAAGRVFRLAVGLISAAYLGPGQTHTHRHVYTTQTHTYALKRRQVALSVCEDTWR